MARAASLDDLFDFEAHWDAALQAVLGQLSGLPVHVGGDPEKLEAPYLVALFSFVGEAPAGAGPLPQVRGGGGPETFDPVSFRGRVSLMLEVQRTTTTPAQLRAWRGGMRRLFLPSQIHRAFNDVVLPYYELRTVTFEAGERAVSEERDLDLITVQIAIDWAIKPDVWPA